MYKFTSFIWFHSLISFIVLHIQKCNKVNGLISFYILISFDSPTYSTVSQIQLYYLLHVHISFNIPNIFINVANSTVLSDSTVKFHSTVPHIQKINKFNILILFTLYLIQHFHIFNSLTNSVLLSNFTFSSHSTVPHIQQCHKFNCLISFYILIYFKSVQIY